MSRPSSDRAGQILSYIADHVGLNVQTREIGGALYEELRSRHIATGPFRYDVAVCLYVACQFRGGHFLLGDFANVLGGFEVMRHLSQRCMKFQPHIHEIVRLPPAAPPIDCYPALIKRFASLLNLQQQVEVIAMRTICDSDAKDCGCRPNIICGAALLVSTEYVAGYFGSARYGRDVIRSLSIKVGRSLGRLIGKYVLEMPKPVCASSIGSIVGASEKALRSCTRKMLQKQATSKRKRYEGTGGTCDPERNVLVKTCGSSQLCTKVQEELSG